MDATPDYAEFSVPTADLGIELPGPIPPVPTGSGAQARGSGRRPVPHDGRGEQSEAEREPLVDAGRDLLCLGCYHRAGWAGTSPTTWLRQGVVSRLLESVALDLPDGFGLAVFDGWRSPETVRALYDHFYGPGSTLEPGYLADPDAAAGEVAVPGTGAATPPHLTGGAVDLTLTWQGRALSLGTPFDEFTPRAHLTALERSESDRDALDRDLRRLLFHVMTEAGFASYDQEWWHFSYGDQAWADHHSAPSALYGAVWPTR